MTDTKKKDDKTAADDVKTAVAEGATPAAVADTAPQPDRQHAAIEEGRPDAGSGSTHLAKTEPKVAEEGGEDPDLATLEEGDKGTKMATYTGPKSRAGDEAAATIIVPKDASKDDYDALITEGRTYVLRRGVATVIDADHASWLKGHPAYNIEVE